MNLLADESVDRQIVERLRADGFSVLYTAEMQPGVDDEVVLAEANRADAILLTADKDFGELVFRLGRIHTGVVLVRLAGLDPETKAAVVADAFRRHGGQFPRVFSVIAPGQVRVRALRSS